MSSSLDYKESFLHSLDKRFDRSIKNEDDDEYLSDSDDEKSASKSDQELDVLVF